MNPPARAGEINSIALKVEGVMLRKKKEGISKSDASKSSAKAKGKKAEDKSSKSLLETKTTRAKATAASKSEKSTRLKFDSSESPAGFIKATSGFFKTGKLAGTKSAKLPRFGQTQMVAFIRDPHCIFTYWEVTPESIEAVKKQLMDEYHDSSMVLRVFRTGMNGDPELLYEINVEPGEMNRYVDIKGPGGSYYIEIGQKTASGRYVPYTRSNKVITSHGWLSSDVDPQWEPPAGILEYFSDEVIEESFKPEKRVFSATIPPKGRLGARRKVGGLHRHAASHF